jgi:hypothetical protein
MINRRTLLKQLAMATTAAMLMPSCISDPKKVSVALRNLDVNGDDEDLMAALAETIIPETDKPGAKTVGAHLFTFVMVDDCQDKASKEKFMKGLRMFEETCKGVKGKTFTASTPEERLDLLTHIEKNSEKINPDVAAFYWTSKRYIMQGYTSSQYYLTEVKHYQLVPGPIFIGCAPVSQTPKSV